MLYNINEIVIKLVKGGKPIIDLDTGSPDQFTDRRIIDSEKLPFSLLDEGVDITPDSSFSGYKNYFRISLTVSDEKIKEGIGKIASEFRK